MALQENVGDCGTEGEKGREERKKEKEKTSGNEGVD
jgi:hypothetical protein